MLEEAIMQTILKTPQKRPIYGQREALLSFSSRKRLLEIGPFFCSFIISFLGIYLFLWSRKACISPY